MRFELLPATRMVRGASDEHRSDGTLPFRPIGHYVWWHVTGPYFLRVCFLSPPPPETSPNQSPFFRAIASNESPLPPGRIAKSVPSPSGRGLG